MSGSWSLIKLQGVDQKSELGVGILRKKRTLTEFPADGIVAHLLIKAKIVVVRQRLSVSLPFHPRQQTAPCPTCFALAKEAVLSELNGNEDTSSPSPHKLAGLVTPPPTKAFSRVRLDTWIFCAAHQVRKESKKRQRKAQKKKHAAKKLEFEVSFLFQALYKNSFLYLVLQPLLPVRCSLITASNSDEKSDKMFLEWIKVPLCLPSRIIFTCVHFSGAFE